VAVKVYNEDAAYFEKRTEGHNPFLPILFLCTPNIRDRGEIEGKRQHFKV